MKPLPTKIIVRRLKRLSGLEDGLIVPANLTKQCPIAEHVVVAVGDLYLGEDKILDITAGDIVFCSKGCGTSFDYVDIATDKVIHAMLIDYNNVLAYKKQQDVFAIKSLDDSSEVCPACNKPRSRNISAYCHESFVCPECNNISIDIIPARDIVLLQLFNKPTEFKGLYLPTEEKDYVGGTYSKQLWESDAIVIAKGSGYFDFEAGFNVASNPEIRIGDIVRIPKSLPASWCFDYKSAVIAYAGEQDLWCKTLKPSTL